MLNGKRKKIISHFKFCSLIINVIINAKKRDWCRWDEEVLRSESRIGTLLYLLLRGNV